MDVDDGRRKRMSEDFRSAWGDAALTEADRRAKEMRDARGD
jgi:hypothetical protein